MSRYIDENACPSCGVAVGERCRVINPDARGKRRTTDIHAARVNAWWRDADARRRAERLAVSAGSSLPKETPK